MNVFGVGLPEMAVIGAVALLVFGPKRLPELGRTLGKTLKGFQSASKEFEREINKAMAEPESLQVFAAGQAAFMRNWPYAWSELNRAGSALAGKVGITTMVSEPGQPHAATQGSWGLALTKGSQHKRAAIEALQFLTSQDSQTKLYEDFGYTPTRQAVFRDPQLVAAHPELPELEAALANAVLRPLTPVYAQISDLLYRELSRVFTGRVSPERGMEQLQEQTLQLRRTAGGAI